MAKKLKAGDPAPAIVAEPVNMGKTFDLGASVKGKPVVVVFSRYFGCPVCQENFARLLSAKAQLTKKASIVYIIQSSKEQALAFFKDKKEVDFPVISDAQKPYPIYDAWGVGKMGLGTLMKVMKVAKSSGYKHGDYEGDELRTPADFVVDTNGTIRHANYSLLDTGAIAAVLESL